MTGAGPNRATRCGVREPLEDTCRALEHLARLGEEFARAIEAGDAALAQAIVGQSRKTRSDVARAQSRLDSLMAADNASESELERLHHAIGLAKVGGQFLSAWFQRTLPGDDRLLTSTEGRRALADRLLGPIWDVDRDAIVLLGHSPALARAFSELGQARLLVVAEGTMSGYPRSATVVGPSEHEIASAIARYQHAKPERVQVFCVDPTMPSELRLRIENEVSVQFQHHVTHWNTLEQHGLAMCRNLIANLPKISRLPTVDALRDLARGRSAIVVSPGPSLDRNISCLREFQDRAVIVAASHALGALVREGIVPDVVVACDMEDLSYHFDVVDAQEIGAVVLSATCHSNAFRMPHERVFTTAFQMPIEQWLARRLPTGAAMSVGGSVAHAALRTCELMGASRIALVGQDLSYPDGRVYAKGHDGGTEVTVSPDGRRMVMSGWSREYSAMESVRGADRSGELDVVTVPGYHGGEVTTSPIFAVFLQWFERVAEFIDAELVNATEGGAAIQGFTPRPLRSLLVDCGDRRSMKQDFALAWNRGQRPVGLRRATHDVQAQLRRVQRLYRDCAESKTHKVARKKQKELLRLQQTVPFLQMYLSSQPDRREAQEEFLRQLQQYLNEAINNPSWSDPT